MPRPTPADWLSSQPCLRRAIWTCSDQDKEEVTKDRDDALSYFRTPAQCTNPDQSEHVKPLFLFGLPSKAKTLQSMHSVFFAHAQTLTLLTSACKSQQSARARSDDMLNGSISVNDKRITCEHNGGWPLLSGGNTTKVEEKEERATNRDLEDTRLDRAGGRKLAIHSCDSWTTLEAQFDPHQQRATHIHWTALGDKAV